MDLRRKLLFPEALPSLILFEGTAAAGKDRPMSKSPMAFWAVFVNGCALKLSDLGAPHGPLDRNIAQASPNTRE